MGESFLVAAANLGKLAQEAVRDQEQVVERHGVGLDEFLFVEKVEVLERLGEKTLSEGDLRAVFRPVEPAEGGLGRDQILPVVELLHASFDESELVGPVVDDEVLGVVRKRIDLPSQYPETRRVKGAYPEPERRAARERLHSLFHLPRGLVREGHGEDLPGRDSVVFYQVGDAVRYHPGLSRTGTREYQKRSFAVTHRFGLGRVQSFEKILFHGSFETVSVGVAGAEGIEPSLPGPKPGVLPLDDAPAKRDFYVTTSAPL